MANEEFSSSKKEFWFLFLRFLAVIPFIMLICFGVTYFIGTFRPEYIRKYNKQAHKWVDGGLEEFSGLVFTMIDSSGNETYKEITQTPGGYYPTYDKCNKKGDPKEGCLLTKARYYDEDIIWMAHENHHIIFDPNGNKILENMLDGSLNYTRSPRELGCRNHLDTCQERCDEMDGYWNPLLQVCQIRVYAESICYRLVKDGDRWVLDNKNVEKLPQNKEFSMHPSDGLGCDYGNNWNSIHYGKKRVSDIRIQLRSSKDSYIAASAYTRSCSNDAPSELNCFGPTHIEQMHWVIVWIYISLGLIGLVILIVLLFYIAYKIKYAQAVRKSNESSQTTDLLTQTV